MENILLFYLILGDWSLFNLFAVLYIDYSYA